MKPILQIVFAVVLAAGLIGCGGGGGGGATTASAPVASTNAFNIKSGYVTLESNGYTKTFAISGTCAGTLTITSGAINTATTFEGVSAISGTRQTSLNLTNCTPSSISDTTIRYFDSNYMPLGSSVQGGEYIVYAGTPNVSTAARVGDVVVVGSANSYTDSTKTTSAGRTDYTYVMEPETATTAILNLIGKNYNASNVLTSTEQDRYRVAANGALTPISLDIQYSNGSTTHLIGN